MPDELLLEEELLLDELLLDELLVLPVDDELLLDELLLVLPLEDELLLDELLEGVGPGPSQAASSALNIPIISILRIIDKAPHMTIATRQYEVRRTTNVGSFRCGFYKIYLSTTVIRFPAIRTYSQNYKKE